MELALSICGGPLLTIEIRVVQILDLGGDLHHRVPSRDHFAAEEVVSIDLGRAVEERRVGLPVSIQFAAESVETSRIALSKQRFELGDQPVAFRAKRHEPAAVLGGRGAPVEEVIAYEDSRKVKVGAHAAKPCLDTPVARVQVVEICVGDISLPLGCQDRHDDQPQKTEQGDRHDRPGTESHEPILTANAAGGASCRGGSGGQSPWPKDDWGLGIDGGSKGKKGNIMKGL